MDTDSRGKVTGGGYTFRWTSLVGLPKEPAFTFLAIRVSAEMAKSLAIVRVPLELMGGVSRV